MLVLVAVCVFVVTGIGCRARRPALSANPSEATRPVSSLSTTSTIEAQIRARLAQRSALISELKALDTQITAESPSPKTSADSAKVQAKQAQRDLLNAQLDKLDAEVEADVERYNALQPSAPLPNP